MKESTITKSSIPSINTTKGIKKSKLNSFDQALGNLGVSLSSAGQQEKDKHHPTVPMN